MQHRMKQEGWTTVWRRIGCWCCWLLMLSSCSVRPDGVQVLDVATRWSLAGQGIAQDVRLPDAWNKAMRSGRWGYETTFHVPNGSEEPWALYIPRAGNRFRVSLNGSEIAQFGGFGQLAVDYAQRPHLVFLPKGLLFSGVNLLRFDVEGESARYAGISTLYVGPAASTQAAYLLRQTAQTWGSFAIVFVAAVFALVSGALAVSMRDGVFGSFALACLFCALRTCYAVFSEAPFDYRWWNVVTDGSLAGYVVCLCIFSVQSLGMRGKIAKWITMVFGLVSAAAIPAFSFSRETSIRQWWLLFVVVYAAVFAGMVVWHWWRQRDRGSLFMSLAGVCAVLLAVYDHVLVFYTRDGYASFGIARYSLLIYLVAMGWLLVDRYAQHARRELLARAQTVHDLEQQKAVLEREYEQLQAAVRERAMRDERQRILEDIHDGVGLQLNGVLSLIQRGSVETAELSREVRTAIEQMRMLVHNTESFDGDVSMLMGQIRYLLQRRLQQVRIALDWDVRLRQPDRAIRPDQALALQRLMFELTTNVIKHARAKRVGVRVDDSQGEVAHGLTILFEDDGIGFDGQTASFGRGMGSIARRVEALGGTYELHAAHGLGVRFILRLFLIASSEGARSVE